MTLESVRGSYFEVLAQNSSGNYDIHTPAEVRTYIGTVDEYPGAIAAGLLKSDGNLWARVYFDRGYTWYTLGSSVVGGSGGDTPIFVMPTLSTVTPGHAGTDTYLFDLGIDCDWRFYSGVGNSNVATCLEQVEFSTVQLKAIYLRDALIIPALGRVIIRASQAHCPYDGTSGTAILGLVQAEWNNNHHVIRDLVACVTPAIGGGVAWGGQQVGTAWGYTVNGINTWDGSFDGVMRHEIGHNWDVDDYHADSPEYGTINCGNGYGRFSGPEVETIFNTRDARMSVLDNQGTYSTVPVPPYAALDSHDCYNREDYTFAPLYNDFDANGETISLHSFDPVSKFGGSITLSAGTGPDGLDELIYSPPQTASGIDHFYYTIIDSAGSTATGVFLARLPDLEPFELYVANSDFEAGGWASEYGTSPSGWVSDPPLSGDRRGNYGESLDGIEGIVAALQDAGGNYYQQSLLYAGKGPIDAGSSGRFDITFDYGYRRDATTNGDIKLRVGLWNKTTSTELAGYDLVIGDPGVGANSLSRTTVNLSYDNTGLNGDELALRFTHTGDGSRSWSATALIDNVDIVMPGSPQWLVDPVKESNGIVNQAYWSTVSNDAVDPEKDSLTFIKVSGPSWLTIASNGALSGTPDASDVGLNVWTVEVTDGTNPPVSATLKITVDYEVFLANKGFEYNTWDSNYGTSPQGWLSDPPLSGNRAGNYGETIIGLPGTVAALQDAGANYYQQALTNSSQGNLDAGTSSKYAVTFDYGYRRDVTTNGDIVLRVALWDTTASTELAGSDLIIIDPGPGANFLSRATVNLSYDNTGLEGHGLAVRFTYADKGYRGWSATALLNNVTVGIPDFTPPEAPTGLLTVTSGGTVSLDWNDSNADGVAAFNIYRSELQDGLFAKIAAAPVSYYEDSGLIEGKTYFYYVTALDKSYNESAESNKAYASLRTPGDLDGDGRVDFADLSLFAGNWLATDCWYCDGADLDSNGRVDFDDLTILAENWLSE
ncbi:Ig-like domain-containing protein [Anaerohalosphaera lusitana]|nr:putative Ig domain-containing protein [Anaerohalosphaera lusitana]